MVDAVLHLWGYEFIRHAFIAGTLAAILAGIVGYFAVARHMAFAAHALGHIGFAGASGALLVGALPIIGQVVITIVAALGMGILGERLNKSDMVIGTVLSFCLGLGALFLYLYHGFAGQATVILFGNLLGVSGPDLHVMLALTILSLLILAWIARPLWFASIEPELAEAKGIPLFWLSLLFIVIMAIAVALTSQVVGIMLVFTLLIGPAAIAAQWSHHFWAGTLFSVFLAVCLVWSSIILSYWTDWPISFWTAALAFLLYLTSTYFRPLIDKK